MHQARQPRGIVQLNGMTITGWISLEVDNNAFRSADTFRVVFSVSSLPYEFDEYWFALQTTITVEIFTGFPFDADNYSTSDLQSLILGNVDSVDFDPVARTIEISGRDKTALLIDTRTSEHFANKTSSQIVKLLAARHGLFYDVVATKGQVGNYYQQDRISLQTEQSEWDLLSYLAGIEGYWVYVQGNTLYFLPYPDTNETPYRIVWGIFDLTLYTLPFRAT